MINVLIINLYDNDLYFDTMAKNLAYYNIPFEQTTHRLFNNINFPKYSHFILTGSDFFILENQIVLSKEQILTLMSYKKPILAQCYGFHLLASQLVSSKVIKTFRKNEYGYFKLKSPLVNPNQYYFINHFNYVTHLDKNWDVISTRHMRDLDGKNKQFILDAKLKEFDVLCLQYHPEMNKNTYDFIYQWIQNSIYKKSSNTL